MATVTVWKDSKKRCNPHARYTASDGTRHVNVPPELHEDAVATDPPVDFSYDTYTVQEIDDAPYVIYTRKSDEQIQAVMLNKFIAAMEAHYDAVAKVKQYDSRLTCTLRAGYPGPFQSEGLAFAVWMDNCNAYGYTEMGKVVGGLRPMPTVDDLIAELPAAPWALPVETVNA